MTSAIKMLAVDVDGTMLRSDGTLSPRVYAALQAAVEAGLHVVPATGRPAVVAADVVRSTDLDQFWVFGNGAVTRHLATDRLVRGFWIEADVAVAIIERIRRSLPTARFAVEFENTLAYDEGFDRVVPNPPSIPPTDDLVFAIEQRRGLIQKVLVFDPAGDLGPLWNLVTTVTEDLAVPSFSGLPFIELAPRNVTKATALELLAGDLGLLAEEVMAVGDNYNDLAMIEWAGVGCAMGNAGNEVKAIADRIIRANDDDGLADLIDELLDRS